MLFTNFLFISSLFVFNDSFYVKSYINNSYSPNIHLISNDIKPSKIGVVDFRTILRKSNSMKILSDKFIIAEKKINKKNNSVKLKLKQKEQIIIKQKDKTPIKLYKKKIKLFKKEVFIIQNNIKKERINLNKSFQKIQNELKKLLAIIIKEISIKNNVNIVLLKENVFLINNQNLDLTNEVLKSFNTQTENLKIQLSRFN